MRILNTAIIQPLACKTRILVIFAPKTIIRPFEPPFRELSNDVWVEGSRSNILYRKPLISASVQTHWQEIQYSGHVHIIERFLAGKYHRNACNGWVTASVHPREHMCARDHNHPSLAQHRCHIRSYDGECHHKGRGCFPSRFSPILQQKRLYSEKRLSQRFQIY